MQNFSSSKISPGLFSADIFLIKNQFGLQWARMSFEKTDYSFNDETWALVVNEKGHKRKYYDLHTHIIKCFFRYLYHTPYIGYIIYRPFWNFRLKNLKKELKNEGF